MKELTKCPFCGGDISHENDMPANEMYDGYSEEDEAMVSFYRCKKCGREIEVSDPTESERQGDYADYWNQQKQ